MTLNQTSVSLDDAQRVIAAGESKAAEIESPSNIAVAAPGSKTKPSRRRPQQRCEQ
jgi:hypothetical protein